MDYQTSTFTSDKGNIDYHPVLPKTPSVHLFSESSITTTQPSTPSLLERHVLGSIGTNAVRPAMVSGLNAMSHFADVSTALISVSSPKAKKRKRKFPTRPLDPVTIEDPNDAVEVKAVRAPLTKSAKPTRAQKEEETVARVRKNFELQEAADLQHATYEKWQFCRDVDPEGGDDELEMMLRREASAREDIEEWTIKYKAMQQKRDGWKKKEHKETEDDMDEAEAERDVEKEVEINAKRAKRRPPHEKPKRRAPTAKTKSGRKGKEAEDGMDEEEAETEMETEVEDVKAKRAKSPPAPHEKPKRRGPTAKTKSEGKRSA